MPEIRQQEFPSPPTVQGGGTCGSDPPGYAGAWLLQILLGAGCDGSLRAEV